MAKQYYIGKTQWDNAVGALLGRYSVVASIRRGEHLFYGLLSEALIPSIVYDEVRPVQPLKTYLIPPLEDVTKSVAHHDKPFIFLGVKNCDLMALEILDAAFSGDFADPHYAHRRRNSLFITSDCSNPLETCFCTQLGNEPYAKQNFDLNLSLMGDGFVVGVGSDRGEALLDAMNLELQAAGIQEIEALEAQRMKVRETVVARNQGKMFTIPDPEAMNATWESAIWAENSKTCVECGACNHACPTCHCYFLDDMTQGWFTKLRGWDSCQYTGYAVTAGGGTPRPKLAERFRNRYFCKFSYLQKNYERLGCTGCGRCAEACQGKIDMRVTLGDLDKQGVLH